MQNQAAPTDPNPIAIAAPSETARRPVDLNFCNSNGDCIATTYCCSDYSCTDPGICLHGGKFQDDMCDFSFECMSRCCVNGVCSHFLLCRQSCRSNSDCKVHSRTPCCSEGFCTDSIVCQGNKNDGDTCSIDEECMSQFCSKKKLCAS